MLAYEALIRRLYQVNKFSAAKLGLRNMERMHQLMGEPCKQYDVVHVAGTNGKGSVSLKIARALETSGYKTGLFVSPHISCFRERMQVNGEYISEDTVETILPQLFELTKQHAIPATFFEYTTLLAMVYFAEQKVDAVVLEAGLGGRLDSTNIVHPALSVITSIGLDHTRILGHSITEIAQEKAGIVKRNVPVVIGPTVPLDIIQQCAKPLQSRVIQVESTATSDFDSENTMIASAAVNELTSRFDRLNRDPNAVVKAIEIRPPCRFEIVETEKNQTVVLDTAHNTPAINGLVKKLAKTFPHRSLRFVCGFSADKDIKQCVEILLEYTTMEKIHFVSGQHPRCASLSEIEAKLDPKWKPHLQQCESDVEISIKKILNRDLKDDVLIVCGSVFLMAEARTALHIDQAIDTKSIQQVAGSHLRRVELTCCTVG